jgi:serine/threonine-protein kinase
VSDDHPTKVAVPTPPTRVGAPGHETDETVALDDPRPRPIATAARSGQGAPPPPTVAATPADAILQAEIARTRTFVPITIGLGICTALVLPFFGGHPVAKQALYGGIVVACAAAGYMYRLTQRPALFTEGRLAIVYLLCIIGIYTAVYYFGVFSPASNTVVLGLFFVGISRSSRMSLSLYVVVIIVHSSLAGAIIFGAVPDYGMVTAGAMTMAEQLMAQGLIHLVLLVTFLIARNTKRESARSLEDLDRAVREVAKREALLEEARHELDRAMQVGGPGRFTEQVLGSYRLGVVIGRGAMGEVYDAVHTETGDPAAVKLLHPAVGMDTGHLTRFLREAQAAAKLRSPNVVALYEVSDRESAIPFLAMERLEGYDLSTLLRERNKLGRAQIVELIGHVARGLDVAREAGVVHRDIKPQNLFLAHSGAQRLWKILDFGVSTLGDHQGTLTQGNVVGTPVYMSPEQARGERVDYRADLYALAAVAYRVITGRPPFGGKDLPAILYNVVYKMPERPTRLADDLPRDVDRALAIGLAKSPRDRFNSAADFADALDAALRGELDTALRRRADSLLVDRPWAKTV